MHSRQQRQLKEYLGPRRPQMPDHHPREYQWATEPIGSIIRDPLHEVMVMRVSLFSCASFRARVRARHQQLTVLFHLPPPPSHASQLCGQGHACVDQLLTALWHAEYHGRYGLYRTAVILLADVGLEFGMTKWCRRVLDEVMPQVRLLFPSARLPRRLTGVRRAVDHERGRYGAEGVRTVHPRTLHHRRRRLVP